MKQTYRDGNPKKKPNKTATAAIPHESYTLSSLYLWPCLQFCNCGICVGTWCHVWISIFVWVPGVADCFVVVI